jgi:hypothetical protein
MKTKKVLAMMMAAVMAGAALTTACSEDVGDQPAPIDLVCGEYTKDTVKVVAGVAGVDGTIYLTYFADITFGRGNPKDANDNTLTIKGSTGAIAELMGEKINFDIVANVAKESTGSIKFPYGETVYDADYRNFEFSIVNQKISITMLGGDIAFNGGGYAAAYSLSSMPGITVGKDMQFNLQATVESALSPTGQLPVSITVIFPALAAAEQERQ